MEIWRIFGEVLEPGEKKRLSLRVSMGGLPNVGQTLPEARKSEDYEMPAILVNGTKPGKTLLVTAGIHSGEYNGIPATIRVARELDPERMSGQVILLPCVNSSGFWTMHPRTLPEDDFNRTASIPAIRTAPSANVWPTSSCERSFRRSISYWTSTAEAGVSA